MHVQQQIACLLFFIVLVKLRLIICELFKLKESALTSLSLCTVTSALRIGSPSSSQAIFAAGYEPHDSQRMAIGCPAVSRSLGVIIFTRTGFTVNTVTVRQQHLRKELRLTVHLHGNIFDDRLQQAGTLRPALNARSIVIPSCGANEQLIHHHCGALLDRGVASTD